VYAVKYVALYEGRKTEVEAETSLKAQNLAAIFFKAKRRYNVVVVPVEKDGKVLTIATNLL
jgi:hypothetical protein